MKTEIVKSMDNKENRWKYFKNILVASEKWKAINSI